MEEKELEMGENKDMDLEEKEMEEEEVEGVEDKRE